MYACIKEKFGDQITFWGGAIDTQHVLPFAGPDKVKEHVHNNVEMFKQGGGFVFNNVPNVQYGVPSENIVTLLDAAFEAGSYD